MFRCSSQPRLVGQSSLNSFTNASICAHERTVLTCSTSYAHAYRPSDRFSIRRYQTSNKGRRRGKQPNCLGVSVAEPFTLDDSIHFTTDFQEIQETETHSQVVPWNKGTKVSDSTKLKISRSQKMRWKNPDLRASVSQKLKGKTPWNKGKTMSEETRRKMSEAKLNRKLGKSVRRKMSKAHMGMGHPPEICSLLSEKLSGKPKSGSHRLKIASSQRKRQAALRVLRAVEAVHRESEMEGSANTGTPRLPPRPMAAASSGSGGSNSRLCRPLLLEAYKSELREYRALQEELSNWTSAFEKQHGRKPKLHDVEATGIGWLVAKYKQYIVLRERILSDTKNLRGYIDKAQEEGSGVTCADKGGVHGAAAQRKIAARAATAADRLAAAQQYRNHQHQKDKAQQLAMPIIPATPVQDGSAVTGGSPAADVNGQDHHQQDEVEEEGLRPLRMPHPTAPPRVKNAIMAAMEYRRRKATATSAQAQLAAVSAEASSDGHQVMSKEVEEAKQAMETAFEDVKAAELSVRHALKVMTLECEAEQREDNRKGMQEMATLH